jgi:uncharacterized protein YndB with AHSA1/START domain
MATSVEKSVTVEAPVSVVYNQWTQFEEFPQFMGGVQEVRQLGDSRLHWVAEIAGVKREWDATILEQVPDEKVAWAATEGATNAGSVRFGPAGVDRTMVTLSLEYEPEGLVEKAGDQLNIVQRQAESDLEKFKQLIESRGSEIGGWRGTVNPGADVEPGVEAAAASSGDSGKAGVSGKAVVAGVAAAGAVAAAATLANKSDKSDQDLDQSLDEDLGEDTDADFVATTETVTPVTPAATTVTATTADAGAAPNTYPAADDPTPFTDDTDTSNGPTHRTL